MLISCVCVCHAKEISNEAIESVVGQSYHDWELIVCDSGVLYDKGYYQSFKWSGDPRIKIIRSDETEDIRKTKAMAPWCYNQCIRKGYVNGEVIVFLCDDDIFYPAAFETYCSFFKFTPVAKACLSSQDVGVIQPSGLRMIVGERRSLLKKGRCLQKPGKHDDNLRMDCVNDYLQLAIKKEVLGMLGDPWWPEDMATQSHADGVLMEKIGSFTPLFPIDIKLSQNRRTPYSTYVPSR